MLVDKYNVNKIIGIKVRVGINNISERGQVMDIELFGCHPLYVTDNQESPFNDICLLTTDPLEFNKIVQPADEWSTIKTSL